MHKPETKDLECKFMMAEDTEGDKGAFTGFASIFDAVDSYGDVVVKGAFKRTLSNKKQFPLLWSHDITKPIGVISAKEDKTGLKVEGRLNLDVQLACEIRSLMKQGAVSGLSIGYQTVKEEPDTTRGARLLKEINLWEISPVVFGACPGAIVADIKGDALNDEPEDEPIVEDPGKPTPDAKASPISNPEQRLHLLDQLRLKF